MYLRFVTVMGDPSAMTVWDHLLVLAPQQHMHYLVCLSVVILLRLKARLLEDGSLGGMVTTLQDQVKALVEVNPQQVCE
jgi:hypothetical protein